MSGPFNLDDQAIIRELGIESSAPEFQQKTLTRIGELLDQRVAVRVESLLSDEELVELDEIGDDQDKFVAYVQAHVPNTDVLVQEELTAIVAELKSFLS